MNTKRKWKGNIRSPLSLLLAVLLVVSGSLVMVSAEPTASGTCDENLTWVLDNGKLTISGEGEMVGNLNELLSTGNVVRLEQIRYGWEDYADQITAVVVQQGVKSIGYGAFDGCTKLTSVTIPDSVTEIDSNAFEGCTGLTSVTIPDSVTEINSNAFKGCSGLTSVTISDGVTEIGTQAFVGCTGLTSITIPDSVTSINERAFEDCTALTDITLPDSLTNIGLNAFDNTAYYNNKSNWENDVLYIGKYLVRAFVVGNCTVKEGTTLIAESSFF